MKVDTIGMSRWKGAKKIEMVCMWEIISMEKDMGKVDLLGIMAKLLRESGGTARKMDTEYGSLPKEITTKVNGSKTVKTGKVTTTTSAVQSTEDNSKISSNTAEANNNFQTETYTWANTRKEDLTVRASTLGTTRTVTTDSFSKVLGLVTVCSKARTAYTKGTSRMMRNMERGGRGTSKLANHSKASSCMGNGIAGP